MGLAAPRFVVLDRVLLEERHQFIQALVEIIRGKKLIVQGSQASEEHLLSPPCDEHAIQEFVGLPGRERKLATPDKRMHRVGIRGAASLLISDDHIGVQSIRAKCEIKVPWSHEPFSRPFGVAVEEMVLITIVNVLCDGHRCHEAELRRNIHMVQEEILQILARQP